MFEGFFPTKIKSFTIEHSHGLLCLYFKWRAFVRIFKPYWIHFLGLVLLHRTESSFNPSYCNIPCLSLQSLRSVVDAFLLSW
jgi:hypothetical protein